MVAYVNSLGGTENGSGTGGLVHFSVGRASFAASLPCTFQSLTARWTISSDAESRRVVPTSGSVLSDLLMLGHPGCGSSGVPAPQGVEVCIKSEGSPGGLNRSAVGVVGSVTSERDSSNFCSSELASPTPCCTISGFDGIVIKSQVLKKQMVVGFGDPYNVACTPQVYLSEG